MLREIMTRIFQPVLQPVFHPVNVFLSTDFMDATAKFVTIGFFVGTMVWVGIILREGYVNRGRPSKSIWTDLRIWTVLAMLPHVFVYLYF